MRIAFFVQYCHEAGTYFRWQNLAKALVQLGNKVDVYAGDFNYRAKKRIEQREGVRYFITPSLITCRIFGNPSDPFTALCRSLQKTDGEYDVYHLFQPFLQAYLPWQIKKYFKKGVFMYDWDDLWTDGLFKTPNSLREHYTFWVVAILEKKIPQIASSTTVCSSFLANRLNQKTKSILIYNGFSPINEDFLNASEKFNFFKEDIFYVGFIGKTADELHWIIEAALIAETELPLIKFVVVGPPKNQLESLGALNFKNIIYLGEVSQVESKYIAQKLSLGLLPLGDTNFNRSRFPIKFFDYLSAQTPVFYSEIGELKFIGKGLHFAYPGGVTKDNWVEGLLILLKNISDKMKQEVNIEQLAENYSWKSIANQLLEAYDIS